MFSDEVNAVLNVFQFTLERNFFTGMKYKSNYFIKNPYCEQWQSQQPPPLPQVREDGAHSLGLCLAKCAEQFDLGMFLQFAEELFSIAVQFRTTAEHHHANGSIQGLIIGHGSEILFSTWRASNISSATVWVRDDVPVESKG